MQSPPRGPATTSRTSHPAMRASCDADFSSILPIPRLMSSSFTTSTSMRASPALLTRPRDQCSATTPIAGAKPVATSTALSCDMPSSRITIVLADTASPAWPSSVAMSAASDGTADRTSTPCNRCRATVETSPIRCACASDRRSPDQGAGSGKRSPQSPRRSGHGHGHPAPHRHAA